eukprot:6664519-Ditylum_brightwellii.AAC.1
MERRTYDVENKVLPFNLHSKITAAEMLLCYACDEGETLSVEEREEISEESSVEGEEDITFNFVDILQFKKEGVFENCMHGRRIVEIDELG